MRRLSIALLAGAGALALLMPAARADQWNKKTVFTFSGPVEIPGQVLPAGTYVFKLADSQSDRNIVQVFNKDENHIFGTFLAIPDYQLKETDKPVILFEERAAGAPQAVRAWFYPGDRFGSEFVYPKVRATELAKETGKTVPAMPEEMAAVTKSTEQAPAVQQMRSAPLKAEKPAGQEVEVAEAFPPAQAAPSAPAQIASSERPASQLPKTASSVPMFALAGFLALGAGASLLALARAHH